MSKEIQKTASPEDRALAKANEQRAAFNTLLDKHESAIQEGLPKNVSARRMIRCVRNAALQNPKIYECTPASIMLAIHRAAMKGLEPDGVLGWLLPYNNKVKLPNGQWEQRQELQFMESYRGLVQLARNTGEISKIVARSVREGDRFEVMQGTEEFLKHVPLEDMPGDKPRQIVRVYAVATFTTGETQFDHMSTDAVEKIRLGSKQPDGPAWSGHWEEMAKKTVVRRLSKMLPISFHARAAMAEHEAEEDERDLPRYVLDARVHDGPPVPALTRVVNERTPARQTMRVVDEAPDAQGESEEEKKPAAKESQKKADPKPAETGGAPNVHALRARAHLGDQDAIDELQANKLDRGEALDVNVDKLEPALAEQWRAFMKGGK